VKDEFSVLVGSFFRFTPSPSALLVKFPGIFFSFPIGMVKSEKFNCKPQIMRPLRNLTVFPSSPIASLIVSLYFNGFYLKFSPLFFPSLTLVNYSSFSPVLREPEGSYWKISFLGFLDAPLFSPYLLPTGLKNHFLTFFQISFPLVILLRPLSCRRMIFTEARDFPVLPPLFPKNLFLVVIKFGTTVLLSFPLDFLPDSPQNFTAGNGGPSFSTLTVLLKQTFPPFPTGKKF